MLAVTEERGQSGRLVSRIIGNFVRVALVAAFVGFVGSAMAAAEQTTPTLSLQYHRIKVVDAATDRGIPIVELRTTDSRFYVTDSAGVVAILDTDLIGKNVFFHLESFGYDYPPNMFGQRGVGLQLVSGGTSTVKMQRINVAERLYRVTGAGIYRDSIILGDKVPATQDESHELITGVDTVQSAICNGKMYWFWGDTSVTRNPLGNFKTTGAFSEIPGKGGLDPDEGVSLTYFRNNGQVRPMFDDPHQPIWVGGPRVLRDKEGKEHFFINYSKVTESMGNKEEGLAEFDEAAGQMRIRVVYPEDAVVSSAGTVCPATIDGTEYLYYANPWPFVRSLATIPAIKDVASLEAYTCVKQGVHRPRNAEDIDRDKEGNLRWSWKKNTPPVEGRTLQGLISRKLIAESESPTLLLDVNTSTTLMPHSGTVYYSPYRKRWISIRCLTFNSASFLGETAYFEADTPQGPWVYGQKIVTHRMGGDSVDKVTYAKSKARTYTFYNPVQHPEFDKDGGRVIYFEGTYTNSFMEEGVFPTPGYNYNQVMYKLDLNDPRVYMPVAIYRVKGKASVYRTKLGMPKGNAKASLAFFAPDRPRKGTVPVYEVSEGKNKSPRLSLTPGGPEKGAPLFYAVDPKEEKPEGTSPLVDLFEYTDSRGDCIYSTDGALKEEGYTKSEKAVCRVWNNPIRFDPLGWGEGR